MRHAMMDYVVQYDTSKPLDLSHNDADIIASIANYLKEHDWKSGELISVVADMGEDFDPEKLPNFSGKPSITIADLKKYDLYPAQKIDENTLVFVAPVEEENGTSYFLGLHNLAVLMTYNQNVRYGLVVDELSQDIEKEFKKA
jgi:membrane-bound lytic murein transglycosylase B